MPVSITKELFLNAIACPLRAWYMCHSDRAEPPSLAQRFRMEQGLDVHRRARTLYPEGVSVEERGMQQAAARTQELMADANRNAIFEAAFVSGEFRTRADLLVRNSDAWDLIEVKSSVNDKPELLDDMAYTAMVMQRAGCTIVRAILLLISRDYRLGMADRDLFTSIDHTDAVKERITEFLGIADGIALTLQQDGQPEAKIIPECRNCDYFATECLGASVGYPIFDIPRLRGRRFDDLAAAGVVAVGDIPADYELTANQERVRNVIVSGQPEIGTGLRDTLNAVTWPAYYLDFETFATAVPLYPNTEPYRAVATQFSVHVCAAPGEVTDHREFLAEPDDDPRPALAHQLVEVLGTTGSIIVYSSYEQRILNDLATVCPDLADRIGSFVERLFDFERVFTEQYTHPQFHGKTSIKMTLPALVPEMSYDTMDIGDGDSASATFTFLAWGKYDPDEARTVRRNLLAYCKQDTLAMVNLHQRMEQIAGD